MWEPLATVMMANHTVIVPDLRGMGLSSSAEHGYDKKTQGQDIGQILDALNVGKADLVTHDIGNMVGYAFAAQYPDRVKRWVAMDAPLPGSATGTRSFTVRRFGISIFVDPTSRDWLLAANVFISTGSGTSFRQIRKPLMKRLARTTPRCTPGRTRCTTPSSSLPHLARMRSTTNHSRQR